MHNKLTDVSILASLKNLVELYLSNNKLTEVSRLAILEKLKVLDLSNNDGLTDVSCFKNCLQLALDLDAVFVKHINLQGLKLIAPLQLDPADFQYLKQLNLDCFIQLDSNTPAQLTNSSLASPHVARDTKQE